MPQIQTSTLFPKEKENLKIVKNIDSQKIENVKSKKLEKDDDDLTPLEEPFIKLAKKMNLSENSKGILEKRYLIKDKTSHSLEKPANLFQRVAQAIAMGDALYGKSKEEITQTALEFFQLMSQLDFLPNSPTLRGAGRKIHQLSACFVLPIEDSMEGIFDALKTTALVHKGGGGTGFSFGRLRPKGSRVGSTDGVAGGPLSFMEIFDTVGRELMQGGVRVGANMGIMPVSHPDILDFIDAKVDGKKFRNFNLSIAVTDQFMQAVENDQEYDLINPPNHKVIGKLKAKEVWEKMVYNAWKNGDPGIIFIDEINRDNPTPQLGQIESTNPCGEQPLLPYESCNLGSLNLARMVKDNKVDWEKLKDISKKAVHFLDNVININKFVHPKIEKMTKGNRKIGLGVMGWADMLVQLGIPYNSEEAIKLAEKVMKFINDQAHQASQNLVEERGVFPNFKNSIYDRPAGKKMHNAAVTTIAPTGTLSLIADCASGIEPFFALVYKKKSIWKQDGTAELEQTYVNKYFAKIAQARGFYSPKLMEKITEQGSLQHLEEIPEDIKKIFVISHNIAPEWHIRMQAAFQKHLDNAVSKTINFPHEATVDEVRKSYWLAYKLKCKGLTIYRDGSLETQVYLTDKTKKLIGEEESPGVLIPREIKPRLRPEVVRGYTYKTKTAYGALYVTVNEDDEARPFEVFAQMGKAGGFFAAKVEAVSRLISLALRSGVDVREIINQLKGIRGPSPIWTEEGTILSVPDAVAKVLEKHLNRGQLSMFDQQKNFPAESLNKEAKKSPITIADLGVAPACPECGGMLEISEGCLKCNSCGFSKCG